MAANVYYSEMYGTREAKYEWLRTYSLADLWPRRRAPTAKPCPNPKCATCCRRQGDVFAGKRRVRLVTRTKKKRQLRLPPPLLPSVFAPLNPTLFPEAVPVPPGMYQGLCRTILQIVIMVGAQKCADASLAVQVADSRGEEAAAGWIRDHAAEFRRGCGAGFTEQPQGKEI